MAGILEHAIGPLGADIVNLGVVLSLMGAMLGYVIIASETPFEAARQGVFPTAFSRANRNGAPIVTALVSAGISQLFLIVSVLSSSTYQFFYACAVSTILVPYVCSAAYYLKIARRREHLEERRIGRARIIGALGFVYTVFLVWAAGFVGIMITAILFAPGSSCTSSGSASAARRRCRSRWTRPLLRLSSCSWRRPSRLRRRGRSTCCRACGPSPPSKGR